MTIKPTDKTDWALDNAAQITPTDLRRHYFGWTTPDNSPSGVGEKPNLEQQNYWNKAAHKRIEYIRNSISGLKRVMAEQATREYLRYDISTLYDVTFHSICNAPELGLTCAIGHRVDGLGGYAVFLMPHTKEDWKNTALQYTVPDNYWKSVCWSPELNLFCAVANNGSNPRIITSPNGESWTSRTVLATKTWNSICWSPELSLFCAVAYDGGDTNTIMTSPDGINWTLQTAYRGYWYGICWSPELNLFCAVGQGGGDGYRVMTSPDGINWTYSDSVGGYWSSICWSPELNLFCAVGYNKTYAQIMTSPDGVTWTDRTPTVKDVEWQTVCWSPELEIFMAGGGDSASVQSVMTSHDGINWVRKNPISYMANYISSICWVPEISKFRGVYSYGQLGVDGITKILTSL